MSHAQALAVPERPPLFVIRDRWVPDEISQLMKGLNPQSELGLFIRRCLPHMPIELAAGLVERLTRCVIVESALSLVVTRKDGPFTLREDWGVVGRKLVTTAGVNFVVDSLQNIVEPELLKFHGAGTGSAAEAVGDTALGTELTTQYSPGYTRPTGSLAEGASANIFRTVATFAFNAGFPFTIQEHGIFTQAATGGGTLLDRTLTGGQAINSAADGIQTTYDLTLAAGG
jgi:hypothetical protein